MKHKWIRISETNGNQGTLYKISIFKEDMPEIQKEQEIEKVFLVTGKLHIWNHSFVGTCTKPAQDQEKQNIIK